MLRKIIDRFPYFFGQAATRQPDGQVLHVQPVARAKALKDPIAAAMERDDLKAAARYWRERLSTAHVGRLFDPTYQIIVRSALTVEELDKFERQMTNQLARIFVYVPDSPLFQNRGVDMALYLAWVLGEIGLRERLIYGGYYTRMRVLQGSEVAFERPPYRSYDWSVVWQAASENQAA